MAREVIEYPTGVSQSSFDIHTHNYRKITRIGGDDRMEWDSPVWMDVVDDSDTYVADSIDLEAAGVTASTQATEGPN